MCFEYSREPSHQDACFEYLQHMFWLEIKKNIFLLHTLSEEVYMGAEVETSKS